MVDDARLKVILEAKDFSTKAFRSFSSTITAVTSSVFSLQGGLASLGVALTGKEVFDAGRNMARLEKSFISITGSAAQMGKEFDFVRNVSERLGQNFFDLIPTYKGLLAASKGSNLEGVKTREIFEGITQASTSLGLSSDQTVGALKAIEQMMSKGKVQAEELRGQLGERLPGAFNLAAQAMGVTTAKLNKMLDDGRVLSDDLLPKLAEVLKNKYSGEVDAATRASNELAESWTDLKTSMAKSGFLDSISESMISIADTFKDPEFKAAMSDFSRLMGDTVKQMASLAKTAGSFWGNVKGRFEVSGLSERGHLNYEEYLKASPDKRIKLLSKAREKDGLRLSGKDVPDDIWTLYEDARKQSRGQARRSPIDILSESGAWDIDGGAYSAEINKFNRELSNSIELQNAMTEAIDDSYGDYGNVMDGLVDDTETATNDMHDAFMGWGAGFSSTLTDVVWGAELSFKSIGESFGKMLTQMTIQKKIVEPVFSKIFMTNAQGNVYGSEGLRPFAQGGVVTGPTVFPFANGTGLMGEAGPEAIMPLTRLPGGDLGVKAAGSRKMGVNHTVHNYAGVEVSTTQKETPGGVDIETVLGDFIGAQVSGHDTPAGRALRSQYGVSDKLVRR